MYDHFPFILAPRSPTAEEVAVNKTANFVWPGLEFDILKSGEAVYVGRVPITKGTLIPFGGQFTTHWEYLVARASNPASVAAWIPVEDHDRDGRPLWFNPAPKNPLIGWGGYRERRGQTEFVVSVCAGGTIWYVISFRLSVDPAACS